MYDDIVHNDKTVGEAIAHNTASLGVGILGNVAGTVTTAFVLGTNPAGWAILGGIAVGIGFTYGFKYLYDNNSFNIQENLDSTGNVLDNIINDVGEGFQELKIFLNPMDWTW